MRILTPGCTVKAEAGQREQICEVSRRQVLQAGISAGVAHSGLQSTAFASQRRLPLPTEAPLVQQNAVTASCAAVEDAAWASQPLAFAFFPHFNFEGAQAPLASLSQPQQVQEAYDSFAGTYDTLDAGPAASLFRIPDLRSQLLAMAQGRVLEAGIGTGINLPLYDRQKVQHIVGVDLSPGMLSEAAAKVRALSLQDFVDLQRGSVEALDQPSSSFDCIVDTFSLCVYPDPVQALREMARVVKPGGRLLLLEHSRSAFEPLGWYQDATASAVAATGKGCKWNQDIPALLQVAGLQTQRMQPSLGGLITLVVASKADSNVRRV